jgi:hypothetical protein
MLTLYTTLASTLVVTRNRTEERLRRRGEHGDISLQWVIFAVAALLVATAVAGAIKLAVDNRIINIK